MTTNTVTYKRIRHAAHNNSSAGGWDLDQWDSMQEWYDPRPDSVPADAEKHSGYLDAEKRQHVLFVRRAPMSEGTCPWCAPGEPGHEEWRQLWKQNG